MSRNPPPIARSADDLTKTTEGNSIELTEEELKRVAGGAIYMKYDGIVGAVTTQGHEKWIELSSVQWKP